MTDLSPLLDRVDAAARCLIEGDARGYFDLLPHAGDYTLMSPYGGDVDHGATVTDEAVAGIAAWFQGGEVELEVVAAHHSADLAVLVLIERQHGRIGGLDQDWSLRVTLVFRRADDRWLLLHRHADALTHRIDHDTLAALARGVRPGSAPDTEAPA
ncbi:nuclear transport factor 2 family protein [Paractinoplanes atraurantiacus]|uniref:Ketosteroid isomerase homolog n=1 Tax=Paractinoplanes atraurantiacus TaxID=1036182 RepID=A0A285IIU3_9ACTN|nr:nuclear transport factor 2 family protein [Actinoplanes atraurantiacus]SNY47823.1 Ketosteroid isomerase homolog [Actinoplanes atraurantiacus]